MDLAFYIQSGVFGLIVAWIQLTHRSAIRAHDTRATEWRVAHDRQVERNEELVRQLTHIHAAVRAAADTTAAGAS